MHLSIQPNAQSECFVVRTTNRQTEAVPLEQDLLIEDDLNLKLLGLTLTPIRTVSPTSSASSSKPLATVSSSMRNPPS